MQRTQIYLPEDLRREIDKHRAQTGESLANYVRKAAEDRLKKNKNKKKNARQIVIEAISSVDPERSGWKDVDVVEWQRAMREDRF